MINVPFAFSLFLGAVLATGCGSAAAPPPTSRPSAAPSAVLAPTASLAATAASSPDGSITTLGSGDLDLVAGTYRLGEDALGIPELPPILVTVPDGWHDHGPFVNTHRPRAVGFVAVSFWHIDAVYGQPCRWQGTLFRPGPTVDDLASALAARPLRSATDPVDVTLAGYTGKYLEWSVPTTADFASCDADGGTHFFESFTGTGTAGDRYQQGPGQIDRLWILDVDGIRLLIDATSMPPTTDVERATLLDVVRSIRFESR